MAPKSYDQLSERGQVARIKRLAYKFLKQYSLDVGSMRLANHGYNTTFCIRDRDGKRFALRINVNSRRTRAQIEAEVAWVKALSEETDLWLPKPLSNKTGSYVSLEHSEELQREFFAVIYSWFEGDDRKESQRAEASRAMGAATKALHAHAANWKTPPLTEWSRFEDVLVGQPFRLNLKNVDVMLFRNVIERGNKVISRWKQKPTIPIHYDLHWYNVKYIGGRLAIFDFDDCIMGWKGIDPPTTLFYTRRSNDAEALESAYWQGYGGVPTDLEMSEDEYECLVACRGVMLANEIQVMNTASIAADAIRYVDVTQQRLRHYVRTGKFDPRVASM